MPELFVGTTRTKPIEQLEQEAQEWIRSRPDIAQAHVAKTKKNDITIVKVYYSDKPPSRVVTVTTPEEKAVVERQIGVGQQKWVAEVLGKEQKDVVYGDYQKALAKAKTDKEAFEKQQELVKTGKLVPVSAGVYGKLTGEPVEAKKTYLVSPEYAQAKVEYEKGKVEYKGVLEQMMETTKEEKPYISIAPHVPTEAEIKKEELKEARERSMFESSLGLQIGGRMTAFVGEDWREYMKESVIKLLPVSKEKKAEAAARTKELSFEAYQRFLPHYYKEDKTLVKYGAEQFFKGAGGEALLWTGIAAAPSYILKGAGAVSKFIIPAKFTKYVAPSVKYGFKPALIGTTAGIAGLYGGFKTYEAGKYIVAGKPEKVVGVGMGIGFELGTMAITSKAIGRSFFVKAYKETAPKARIKTTEKMLDFAYSAEGLQPKVKPLKSVLKETEMFAAWEQDTIIASFKKHKVVVGGSVAQRTQTYDTLGRKIGDVDAYVKKPTDIGRELAKQLGAKIKVRGKGTHVILSTAKYKMEFHDLAKMTSHAYYMPPVKTPEGIKVFPARSQIFRKSIGYLEAHRAKDYPSGMELARSMLKTSELQARQAFWTKPIKEIRHWQMKRMFGRLETKKEAFDVFGVRPFKQPLKPKAYKAETPIDLGGKYTGGYYKQYPSYKPYKVFAPYKPYRPYKKAKRPSIFPAYRPFVSRKPTPFMPFRKTPVKPSPYDYYPYRKPRVKPTIIRPTVMPPPTFPTYFPKERKPTKEVFRFKIGSKTKEKKKRFFKGFKFSQISPKYKPSLVAGIYGIKAPKMAKFYGGLGVRPIIKKRKK